MVYILSFIGGLFAGLASASVWVGTLIPAVLAFIYGFTLLGPGGESHWYIGFPLMMAFAGGLPGLVGAFIGVGLRRKADSPSAASKSHPPE